MTIRAPHLSGRTDRKVQAPQVVVSLLVTTLAVPFAQYDWPNPQIEPVQQPFQVGMPLGILEDAGEKPFLLSEWPQPDPLPTIQIEQVPKFGALGKPFFLTDLLDPERELFHFFRVQASGRLVQ